MVGGWAGWDDGMEGEGTRSVAARLDAGLVQRTTGSQVEEGCYTEHVTATNSVLGLCSVLWAWKRIDGAGRRGAPGIEHVTLGCFTVQRLHRRDGSSCPVRILW